MCGRCEGKSRLIKGDMTREIDPVSLDIEANVTAMIRRVAKKDTRGGTRVKLVGGSGGLIREA